MNNTKQFWTLFRFQTTVNPFIWFMPVAFGLPLFVGSTLPNWYHATLSSLITTQNLFFVGIFGTMVVAPERFMIGAANAAWNPGTEFLLTRAVDRRILYRSKATFLYVLILLMPLVSIGYSLDKPDLKVIEYSDVARQRCLALVPGSTLEKDPMGSRSPLISIPRGNVLVAEWHFWSFIISILGLQVLILILYSLKFRVPIFYTLFMGSIFVPLVWDLSLPSYVPEGPFFFLASHPLLFWSSTALAVVLCQLWCERRFARLEQ